MNQRPRLHKLIVISLACWMVLLSLVVALHGHLVNEYVESRIWESMLESEMAYIKHRIALDPDYQWADFDVFQWYDERSPDSIPAWLMALPEGLHDEVANGQKQFVVLVENSAEGRRILALDITDLENRELTITLVGAASVIFLIAVLTLFSLVSVNRLLRPLTRMADEIPGLRPDGEGRRITIRERDAHETRIIADAINGYSDRIREHGERERNFINMASHELRTPIAVVAGVNEVLLDHPDTTPAIREHLLRSGRIFGQMEDLVTLLLALARAPDRLVANAETLDVCEEMPSIVADHMHLCEGKDLSITVELDAPIPVSAPLNIVRVAIGNLLRNAIENCDSGVIRIRSLTPGSLTIDDPGHGMSAQEMSQLYTRMAKFGRHASGGIGIDLIVRICSHFGWRLDFVSAEGKGTQATLAFVNEPEVGG